VEGGYYCGDRAKRKVVARKEGRTEPNKNKNNNNSNNNNNNRDGHRIME
jgi:hypothetical protein